MKNIVFCLVKFMPQRIQTVIEQQSTNGDLSVDDSIIFSSTYPVGEHILKSVIPLEQDTKYNSNEKYFISFAWGIFQEARIFRCLTKSD